LRKEVTQELKKEVDQQLEQFKNKIEGEIKPDEAPKVEKETLNPP
jgi:hypothetical protein